MKQNSNKNERPWAQALFKRLKPRPVLSVSEWADKYRTIPRGTSPEPGQWRTSRVPYLKEILDSFSDRDCQYIVFQAASQIAKTEALLTVMGYFADQDPAPQLVIQPTLDMCEGFSKERVEPMFKESKGLRGKLEDGQEGRGASRKSSNTIRMKHYPGGYIAFAGANSPAGLASRPIRVCLFDEVDRYPEAAGIEGDPLKLGIQRTVNFYNRKIGIVSTPTISGVSKIEDWYERSDKRKFYVPCPFCGKKQILTWSQIKWHDSDPSTAAYVCKHCDGRIEDKHKDKMLSGGEWITEAESEIRGFHLSSLYSPWIKFSTLAAEWVQIHKERNKKGLMEFINLKLGEPWIEDTDDIDLGYLEKRREYYNAVLPEGVLCLTASVDVQDDRLEAYVVGWGIGKETWAIDYKIFVGDPGLNQVWNDVDNYLLRSFRFADESAINISCTCIDSGGHFTDEVYIFCKQRETRRIFAIKGKGGSGVPLVGKPSRNNRKQVALFSLGVDTGKDLVYSRLKIEHEGPGYCHFPRDINTGFGQEYFKGLLSERRVIEFKNGMKRTVWKKVYERNEPLDLAVYATAAFEILNPNLELLAQMMQKEQKNMLKSFNNQSMVVNKPIKRRTISKGIR